MEGLPMHKMSINALAHFTYQKQDSDDCIKQVAAVPREALPTQRPHFEHLLYAEIRHKHEIADLREWKDWDSNQINGIVFHMISLIVEVITTYFAVATTISLCSHGSNILFEKLSFYKSSENRIQFGNLERASYCHLTLYFC